MDPNPIDRDLKRIRRILPLPLPAFLERGSCPFRKEAEGDFSRRTPGNPKNPTDATYRAYTCADVGDFRALRSVIMTNVWARAHSIEAAGRRLSNWMFGNLVEEEWDKAKAKARECRVEL